MPPCGALPALACSFSIASLSFRRRPENHTCSASCVTEPAKKRGGLAGEGEERKSFTPVLKSVKDQHAGR